MYVAGEPRGGGQWRAAVAAAAWPLTLARADIDPRSAPELVGKGMMRPRLQPGPTELRLDFVVRHWVDLDTILSSTLAGLRDAGWYGRGFGGLRGLLATKTAVGRPGATITGARVTRERPPGGVALELAHEVLPRDRAGVRRWRDALAAAWAGRPPLDQAPSWVDVSLGGDRSRSLLGGLEPVLDALEPVLGRDPRGRTELFPNDHLVTWLRVRRGPVDDPPLRVRLGPTAD